MGAKRGDRMAKANTNTATERPKNPAQKTKSVQVGTREGKGRERKKQTTRRGWGSYRMGRMGKMKQGDRLRQRFISSHAV